MTRRRRVAVTGALGLIGRQVVRQLLVCGSNEVFAIDRLSPGGLDAFLSCPSVTFVQDDLTDVDRIRSWLDGVDLVVHLAAGTDMTWKIGDPMRDLDQGQRPLLNLLEAMRHEGVTSLVQASSSAVYGDLAMHGASEQAGPLLPSSTYGAAKLAAEAWISAYATLLEWRVLILRFGNVIGPLMDRGLLYDVVRKLLPGPESLAIRGDGTQARTYIHVVQAVEAMFHLHAVAPRAGVHVFNVSGTGLVDTISLVRLVEDTLHLVAVPIRHPAEARGWPGDVPRVDLDLAALATTGWTPTDSRAAIRRTTIELAARLRHHL